MQVPRITISATNVELTHQLEHQVRQRLAPLIRVFRSEDISFTVQIRKAETEFGGVMHFVSVKMKLAGRSYTAVSAKPYLSRSLTAAADMLRRSMSRGASVSPYTRQSVESLKETYTLTL